MGRRKEGPGSAKVIPVDHTNVEWLSEHGGLFLEQEGACGSCHDSPSCKLCHKTVMPHPPDWLENHAPADDVAREDCNVCHTDRSSCQNCHHDARQARGADRGELRPVPRRDERRSRRRRSRHKGFAEHAVHFNVAESEGRSPTSATTATSSFGTSTQAQEIAKLQGHDLRLCYDCHGALDVFDTKIAPYPGASLCRQVSHRCEHLMAWWTGCVSVTK